MGVKHAMEMGQARVQLQEERAASEALRSKAPPWHARMGLLAEDGREDAVASAPAAGDTEDMLLQLHAVVNQWVGMLVPQGCAHLYAFGSYLLVGDLERQQQASEERGRRTSDVDILVVVPAKISREHHFFGEVKNTLEKKKRNQAARAGVLAAMLMIDPRVKNLISAPDAYVPCLRLEFQGLDVDLTLACLDIPVLPPQQPGKFWALQPPLPQLTAPAALPPVRKKIESFRSMNGVLTTHAILHAVPSVTLFRTLLLSVRKWAKARGLYGPTFGYPAGITWALLTAAVRLLPFCACRLPVFRSTMDCVLPGMSTLTGNDAPCGCSV